MARFRSTASFVINGHQKFKAGTIFADTKGNALAGDVVWPDCANSSSMSPALVPLDGAATTIFNGSRFVGQSIRIDGANSVGGQ